MTLNQLARRVRRRGVAAPIILVALWALLPAGKTALPTLSSVLETALTSIRDGGLEQNYLASLARVAIGFTLGAGAGFVAGAGLGISPRADRLLGPLMIGGRQIPLFGLVPLLGLWFGIGEPAKIVLVAIASFFPVALNTHEGIRNVPLAYREVAAILTFNRRQYLTRVLLPGALPAILTGLKQGLSFAWIAVVGAELFLAAAPGLGNFLEAGREQFRMDLIVYGIILIAGTGTLMTLALSALERRLLRWRPAFA